MNNVNFYRTYFLDNLYDFSKKQSSEFLGNYLSYPDLYKFNDKDNSLTFKSERLVPTQYSDRPRVMLLFSNPHPNSVHEGMLLSPSTRGRENLFWVIMQDADWINFDKILLKPKQIAKLCFKCEYDGPFDYVFYPYYVFPTLYPTHIKKIFGKDFFRNVIETEAKVEFLNTIRQIDFDAIVVFNIGIFNHVSVDYIEYCRDKLVAGEIIQSQISKIDKSLHSFYTFPTGWRFHVDYRRLRIISLDKIRQEIFNSLD